jgi:hypothetical protein
VRAVAGARTFDGDWNTVRPTGLGKRGSIFLLRALVEIDRQEPTRLVVEQRIATDDMPACQVINNDLVVYRDEGLICAVRALASRVKQAEPRFPLVQASRRVARIARLLAHEADGEDVRAPSKKMAQPK